MIRYKKKEEKKKKGTELHPVNFFKWEFTKLWHDQGNESDVVNIDFELQAKRGDKF